MGNVVRRRQRRRFGWFDHGWQSPPDRRDDARPALRLVGAALLHVRLPVAQAAGPCDPQRKARPPKTLTPLPTTPAGPAADAFALSEYGAWKAIDGTWRRLHTNARANFGVEWHDFRLARDLDWGRTFHPGTLEVCLNFSGTGTLRDSGTERTIGPGQVAVYTVREGDLRAMRRADSLHRFLTLELLPGFLHAHFDADELAKLTPAAQRFAESDGEAASSLRIGAMPAALLAARTQFVEPPVPGPARNTWYLARVLEILAQTIFPEEDPAELFCKRHQRCNRERIERARFLIERDLENSPTLEMLAREVGCSPFYLSRLFAQETGASIPKFLRLKRLEKAAELLRTGRANVTEAAFAVGYASLRAFDKAFLDHFGCCPGLYPHGKIRGRSEARGGG